MIPLSPIRSASPISRPKIVFNYQASPLKERPSLDNYSNISSNYQYVKNMTVGPKPNSNHIEIKGGQLHTNCFNCSKQATYRVAAENRVYCSTCAINEIKRGVQIVRIQLKDQSFYKDFQNKTEQQNKINNLLTTPTSKQFRAQGQGKREKDIQQLLTEVSHEQQELKTMLDKLNSEQLTTEGIKGIYRTKKMNLKKHYERIKAAIKISIEKDLEELDKRQKQSQKCITNKRNQLQYGILKLGEIREDIEPNKQQILANIKENDYQCMMTTHKAQTKKIVENKQYSARLIKELTSHQLFVNSNQNNQIQFNMPHQSQKQDIYDPYNYTLIDCKHMKGETLFSFQKKGNEC